MPFCWATGNTGNEALNYTVQAQTEAIIFNRNHPSVILWSLGNESPWTSNFQDSYMNYLRRIDTTRPYVFDGGSQQPVPPLDLMSVHYPGFDGPHYYGNLSYPVLFGEYAHLNCYNRREVLTDPGVRNIWGLGVSEMWELMYPQTGVLGGCYWAGIDDMFVMPSDEFVGYGPWGVIDSWRRYKPETYIVQQIYSPVRLTIPDAADPWEYLLVDNRYDFTYLEELNFTWTLNNKYGLAFADGAPRTTRNILRLKNFNRSLGNGTLLIEVHSPLGFSINKWAITVGVPDRNPPCPARSQTSNPPTVLPLPDGGYLISLSNHQGVWKVDPQGQISGNTSVQVLKAGPTLMVLPINNCCQMQLTEDMPPITPFNSPCIDWRLSHLSAAVVQESALIYVNGTYANASGGFVYSFDDTGFVNVSYEFVWTSPVVNVRQLGLVFDTDISHSYSYWKRQGPYSTYPEDHIGRLIGRNVSAGSGPIPTPRKRPIGSYASDATPYGSNDFRSTKQNFTEFTLCSIDASSCIASFSDGSQHSRPWVDNETPCISFLVAQTSNEGGNPFSREAVLPHPVVRPGDKVRGVVTLRMYNNLTNFR